MNLEYILTSHSKEGIILMFRIFGSDPLVILGLAIEKLFPHLTLIESLSQTGSFFLVLISKSAMHFKFLVSPSF